MNTNMTVLSCACGEFEPEWLCSLSKSTNAALCISAG